MDQKDKITYVEDDSNTGFVDQVKNAKNITKAYNIGSVAVFVLCFLRQSQITVAILLIYPLLSIPVIYFSKHLICFFSEKQQKVSSLFFGVFVLLILLWIKTVSTYTILTYKNFWISFITVSLITFLVFCLIGITNTSHNFKTQIIIFLIISGIYSYGCVIQLNCVYDFSREEVFRTAVYNRYTYRKNYYLSLNPWYPQMKPISIGVSPRLYKKAQIDSLVTVHLKKGLLNISWLTVSD